MELLNQYLALQNQLYAYFEYTPNELHETVINDLTGFYWCIQSDKIYLCGTPDFNQAEIFAFEPIKVYRKADYTLIQVAYTTIDLLYIIDNTKQLTD